MWLQWTTASASQSTHGEMRTRNWARSTIHSPTDLSLVPYAYFRAQLLCNIVKLQYVKVSFIHGHFCYSYSMLYTKYVVSSLPLSLQVLVGFQKFGQPSTVPVAPPTGHTPSLLGPCVQGVQYGVRCLAQLTATQYAATTCPGHKPPSNQGRLILLCSLHK